MNTAFIVIDSGFERDVIRRAQVIGVYDLRTGLVSEGEPFVAENVLDTFAGDPGRHGTLVLDRFLDVIPDAPVILVRAIGDEGLICTQWTGYDATFRGGSVTRPGWTEALKWAVDLCKARSLQSVTNCSFGNIRHAADGTGWEARCVAEATAGGGHIVVAAAGAGNGRSGHATWRLTTPGYSQLRIYQRQTSTYNLWSDVKPADHAAGGDNRQWTIKVFNRHSQLVHETSSRDLLPNIWNGRQQLKFQLHGEGEFFVEVTSAAQATGTTDGDTPITFDCWALSENAFFLNHVNPLLIVEPAVFPDVIAVGLIDGQYNPRQTEVGQKPDVLLPGGGPISFRAPQLSALIVRLLEVEPGLDVKAVLEKLGKYPA